MEEPVRVEESARMEEKPVRVEENASAVPPDGGSAPSPLATTRAPKAAPPSFDPTQPPLLPTTMMGKGMLLGKAKGAPLGMGGKGALPPVASVPARSFDDDMPMGKGGYESREPVHDGREARSRSRNRERRAEPPISKSSPRSTNYNKGGSSFIPMHRMGQSTMAPRPVGKGGPPMIAMHRMAPDYHVAPNSKGKGEPFDTHRAPLMQSNLTSMISAPPGMGMGMGMGTGTDMGMNYQQQQYQSNIAMMGGHPQPSTSLDGLVNFKTGAGLAASNQMPTSKVATNSLDNINFGGSTNQFPSQRPTSGNPFDAF
eukprot:GEMP01033125.1.p1 GENE.GEMP01033125.1~~GEMP01033125.1.p1  ORF type:complete len:349 (+),score=80.66 GEMP01033125.1:110-1048(+)